MKNMIKRIIVGVAIGTILFIIKGGNVFASTYTPSNFTHIIVHYSFDLCTLNSGTFVCVDAFSDTQDLKTLLTNVSLYTTKSNEYLMLKELSVQLDSSNSIYTSNGFELPPFSSMFTGLNMNTKLYYNDFLNYYGYKTSTSATEYTTLDNNKWGAYYYTCSTTNGYKYCIKPYVYFGSTKNVYSMLYSFQSGYNYVGSNSIIDSPTIYSSDSDLPSARTYITNEKNNTYLAVVLPNTTLTLLKASNLSSGWGGFQLINGNWDSTAIYDFAPTTTETEINENMAEINKQIYIASSWIGSDTPDSEQFEDISSSISVLSTGINNSLSTFGFQDFLAALIQKPITELTFMIRIDNIGGTDNNTIKCPTIYIPFKKDHTTGTNIYGMYLPCMSDLYSQIPYVGSSGDNLGSGSLIGIYQTILTGFLSYLLVLSWLNIIKHTITNSPSEIEVYEL